MNNLNRLIIVNIFSAFISLDANASIVAIVSANSPISALSKKDLGNIFLGKSGSLDNGEKIAPIDQSSGTIREEFYQAVLGKTMDEIKAYWSREIFTGHGYPPPEESGDNAVKLMVAHNPNYVGYIESSSVDGTVKVVTEIK